MEGRYEDPAAACQALHSFFHLPGRLVRKRDGQDVPRRDPFLAHHIGDPVRERPRLAGPCPRQDQDRPLSR